MRRIPRDDLGAALPAGDEAHEALAELARCAGTQSDPDVVAAIRAELAAPDFSRAASGQAAPGPAFGRLIAS